MQNKCRRKLLLVHKLMHSQILSLSLLPPSSLSLSASVSVSLLGHQCVHQYVWCSIKHILQCCTLCAPKQSPETCCKCDNLVPTQFRLSEDAIDKCDWDLHGVVSTDAASAACGALVASHVAIGRSKAGTLTVSKDRNESKRDEGGWRGWRKGRTMRVVLSLTSPIVKLHCLARIIISIWKM